MEESNPVVPGVEACKVCGKPAEDRYVTPLCPPCRTSLVRRPFPVWIKFALLGITLLGLFSITRVPAAMSAAIAFERGQRAERSGHYEQAASEYGKVSGLFPDSVLPIARQGIAQYRAGRSHAAAETFSKIEGREASAELTAEVTAVIKEMEGLR